MAFEKINQRVQQLLKLYKSNAPERFEVLEERIQLMTKQQEILLQRLEEVSSRFEVTPYLIDEFRAWKAANPVPRNPKVSCCVATYNRSKLLVERCIASIQKQTYSNWELIVVGDHCTDDTAEAIAKLGDTRIRFENLPVRGPYPEDPRKCWMVAGTFAMNKALSLTTGDYITHLDDDDEHTPERLEQLIAFAGENEYDFVWHPFWYQNDYDGWQINEAVEFAYTQVTTSSVFYRAWFKNIGWDINAYQLLEPGDWNRFRRIRHFQPNFARYPTPSLRHYKERTQHKVQQNQGTTQTPDIIKCKYAHAKNSLFILPPSPTGSTSTRR